MELICHQILAHGGSGLKSKYHCEKCERSQFEINKLAEKKQV